MPKVNPEILTWARETAGLDLEQAVHKLGIKDAHGLSAVEKLVELENGEVEPSRSLLVRMSQQYRRSLLVFYLATPPEKGDRGEDFRTLPGSVVDDNLTDTLIRIIKTRQNIVRAALEDAEIDRTLSFVASAEMRDGVNTLVKEIKDSIHFDVVKFRKQKTKEDAFSYLRQLVEAAGVYVLLMGNLGSHHTNISPRIFRGFALADKVAPFIVINDQDSPAAWSFTLMHELAHLWLGKTGVSGANSEQSIERFCNDVASQFLLPDGDLHNFKIMNTDDFATIVENISNFANSYNVSRSMVAYRLNRLGLIEYPLWQSLSDYFYEQWRQAREARKKKNKERDGGPNAHIIKRHRLGAALLSLVKRTLYSGEMTPTKASKVLGVKPRSVIPLVGANSSERLA